MEGAVANPFGEAQPRQLWKSNTGTDGNLTKFNSYFFVIYKHRESENTVKPV